MSFLVSVLVPSRGRVEQLKKSLESLLATCDLALGKQLEIIIRIDNDDRETENFLLSHPQLFTTMIHGHREKGRADLHHMYNEMCRLARGRFFFMWSDDATMLTPGWDLEIAQHDDGKLCYLRSSVDDSRGRDQFLFPIVHRSYYDVLGHFSRSSHNDMYVFSALKSWPNVFRNTDIVINQRVLSANAEVHAAANALWDGDEIQAGLQEDVRRIDWLLKQQTDTT